MSLHHSIARDAVDAISAVAVVGSLLDYAPKVAAVLGCVWYVVRLWDWWQLKRAKKDTSALID